jgi:hypothetical protein
MIETLIGLAHLIAELRHLPALIRFAKKNPGISISLGVVIVAGSLVAILIRRVRHDSPITIR